MPEWIIRSKLHPQVRLRNLVSRTRLVERLDESFDAGFTLVHAPAGYGKSTCLAQWRGALLDRDVPVAWSSFDEHDAELFQFVTYLSESCVEAGFGAGRDFPRISDDYSVMSGAEFGSALVAGFSRCKGPHVVILDDYHRAQSPEVAGFVDYLRNSSPANIHFVISSRELPANLPIADLRIHDELLEITQDDLRFSAAEIRTFFDYWVDESESTDWPGELYDRTEGWPVALQTVRRWAAEGTTIDETLKQLSGRTSDLADYFLEQVFNSMPDETREFLLTTSILERVNGDIGNAICGGSDGWRILQDLDQKDVFVQSLDRQRTWYRYHRLFTEFLQERLRRTRPSEISTHHRVASRWFRDNGHTTEALQHAIAGNDIVVCAELLEEQGGWHYALRGHVAVVQSVLTKLGAHELHRYPRLWLAKIYLAIRLGQMESGEAEIARFEEICLSENTLDAALAGEATVMKATVGVYGDKPVTGEIISGLEALGESIPADNHVLHASRSNLLCAMYRDAGRFDDCMAVGDQAISHYRAMGSLYGETFIYFHEGLACLRQARLRDAEALYREGFDIAVDNFGEDSDLAAIGRVFLAEVSYEKNRLHESRQYLENSIRHIEKADAWIDVYLAAYLTRMKLLHAAGNDDEMDHTVSRARSTSIHRGLGRLQEISELQRRELSLRRASAPEKPARAVRRPTDEISRQFVERIHARELLASGQYREACEFLAGAVAKARKEGQVRFFVSLAVLHSAARWLNKEPELAVDAFESALSASMFEGIKRPFIDEGDLVSGVINEISDPTENRRGNRLRDSFIAELSAEIEASSQSKEKTHHVLSPREREVLRYVMQGQSNREIAEAIPLSINTVKFHLKNVFEKLGVSSRKDAVSLAIRQRLV